MTWFLATTWAQPAALPCGDAPVGMSCVPGGPGVRGADVDHPCEQQPGSVADRPNHAPAGATWVQTFYMDQTEVTYEAYQACVAAGKCRPAKPSYNDYDRPRQPMVGLPWFAARQFCTAQGKHLPTEAEWEKAARGAEGDPEPWGSEPATCERAVVRDESGRSCGTQKAPPNPEKGRTLEVGSRVAGRYGLFDMVGNAEEWVADWYTQGYAACGDACFGVDPKGPCGGADACPGHDQRVVKGGSWYWPGPHATGYHRRPHFPANQPYHHYGFRCAASVDERAAIGTSP